MLTKYLLTALVILVVWMVFNRLRPGRPKPRAKPPIMAQETTRCERCGIFLPLGQTCGCADRA